MENGPLVDNFPIETSIDRGFSIATFDYQRVILKSFRTSKIFKVLPSPNVQKRGHSDLHVVGCASAGGDCDETVEMSQKNNTAVLGFVTYTSIKHILIYIIL